jgi:hypothetical protein
MLILGREDPELAGIGSEVAEPTAAFVSGVEVMQHILAGATDTMTRGTLRRLQELATQAAWKFGARLRATKGRTRRPARQSAIHTDTSCSGALTTIEPMTMRAARIATRPDLAKHCWAPA